MSPRRVDTTLALADWLFNFFLVFIFCYLLHTCLTVLNVFCKSTSFRILYIYSLITFTMVYKFSNLNHINKAGPILMLAWLVHNLTGKIIIGPNVDIFFFVALLMTIPDSIDSTLLNPGCTDYWSLPSPWGAFTDPPSSSVPTCFLPAFPGTPVGCSMNYLRSPGMCPDFTGYVMSMTCSFISNGPSDCQCN